MRSTFRSEARDFTILAAGAANSTGRRRLPRPYICASDIVYLQLDLLAQDCKQPKVPVSEVALLVREIEDIVESKGPAGPVPSAPEY